VADVALSPATTTGWEKGEGIGTFGDQTRRGTDPTSPDFPLTRRLAARHPRSGLRLPIRNAECGFARSPEVHSALAILNLLFNAPCPRSR